MNRTQSPPAPTSGADTEPVLAAHTPMMQQCVLPGVDVQIERKLRQNLRLKVIPRTGLARSTICRLIAQRQFASSV